MELDPVVASRQGFGACHGAAVGSTARPAPADDRTVSQGGDGAKRDIGKLTDGQLIVRNEELSTACHFDNHTLARKPPIDTQTRPDSPDKMADRREISR